MAKFALLLAVITVALSPASALWPLPTGLQSGNSTLKLASSFDIKLNVNGASQDLKDAVTRTKAFLKNDKLERLVVGRGASDMSTVGKAKTLSSLTVSLASGSKAKSIASEAVAPLESRNDAYTLTIPADGSAATLTSNSSLGLFRGLTTFSQIWYTHSGQTYTIEAPFKIDDKPAYVGTDGLLVFVST
jgi:hexosaminidase